MNTCRNISFYAETPYFYEHTLNSKRNIYYRTEPNQAELSLLPLLRSACFLSVISYFLSTRNYKRRKNRYIWRHCRHMNIATESLKCQMLLV